MEGGPGVEGGVEQRELSVSLEEDSTHDEGPSSGQSPESGYASVGLSCSSSPSVLSHLVSPMGNLRISSLAPSPALLLSPHRLVNRPFCQALSPIREGARRSSAGMLLRSTGSLPSTPLMHSSPYTSVCLIGREQVDFLTELYVRRNIHGAVSSVLSHLSSQDLLNVSCACRAWRRICNEDEHAHRRLCAFKAKRRKCKENLRPRSFLRSLKDANSPASPAVPHPYQLGPRRSLSEIQMFRAELQPDHSILRRSTSMKDLFDEAARDLPEGGHLCKCPICSSPCALLPGEARARCGRRGCSKEFCARCRGGHPQGTPCKEISGASVAVGMVTPTGGSGGRRTGAQGLVGSQRSRKNLRRLL